MLISIIRIPLNKWNKKCLDSKKKQKRLLEAPIFQDKHLYKFQQKKPKENPGPARVIYTAGKSSRTARLFYYIQLTCLQIMTSTSVVSSPTLSPTTRETSLYALRCFTKI